MCIHFDTRKNLNCVEKWRCKDVFLLFCSFSCDLIRWLMMPYWQWVLSIFKFRTDHSTYIVSDECRKKMFASYNPIESQAVDTNSILRANQVDFVSRLLATIWPHWCQSIHFQCFFFSFLFVAISSLHLCSSVSFGWFSCWSRFRTNCDCRN